MKEVQAGQTRIRATPYNPVKGKQVDVAHATAAGVDDAIHDLRTGPQRDYFQELKTRFGTGKMWNDLADVAMLVPGCSVLNVRYLAPRLAVTSVRLRLRTCARA